MAVAPKGTKEIAYREWPTLFALDGYFVCGIAHKPRWVNISFFRGAELDDADGVLEGTGKGMRHVKLREPKDAASPALKRILREAFKLGGRDMRGRTPTNRLSRG